MPEQEFYAKPRVALGLPSHDTMMQETAISLAALVGYTAENYIASGQMEIRFVSCQGTILGDMRNAIVEKAQKLECTHILWIDADMKFPANGLELLLKHNKPVVGCNYSRRRSPCKPTAGGLPKPGQPNGYQLYTEDQKGIEKVQYLGMGFCLTEMTVFEALPKPWFFTGWREEEGKCIGEDVFFFRNLPMIDCPAFVDHDLSRHIGHIGHHEYTHDDCLSDRPEVLAMQKAPADDDK